MRKSTKIILISVASFALFWAAMTTLYTHSVSTDLRDLRRENNSDSIYLRARIRQLESQLTDALLERIPTAALPADTETAPVTDAATAFSPDTEPAVTEIESDTQAAETVRPTGGVPTETVAASEDSVDTESEPIIETAADTEAVTLPTPFAPETQPTESLPSTDPTDTLPPANDPLPSSLFMIAEHNGIIGVFDATGELLRTVNVIVEALPEADRRALEIGLPMYDWDEVLHMLERYE